MCPSNVCCEFLPLLNTWLAAFEMDGPSKSMCLTATIDWAGVNCTIQQKILCTFIGKAIAVLLKVHLLRMQLIIESIAFALDDTEKNWAGKKLMHKLLYKQVYRARGNRLKKDSFLNAPSGLCVLIVLDAHMHANRVLVLIFRLLGAEPHEIHEIQKLSGPKLPLISTGENFI